MSSRDWITKDAACKGKPSGLFFDTSPRIVRAARELCATCPLQLPCAAYALSHNEPGVWGGTTPQQRGRARTAFARGGVAS